MRLFFLGLLFFLIQSVSAQYTEDFSDGNFTFNPHWSGDSAQFIVNAQQQLQLNSSGGTSPSYLSTDRPYNSLDSIEWRCFVHLNFSPSSSNNGRIYIVSDSPDLKGPLNGYFIQLGESLSGDAVELFEQNQSTITSIARGTNGAIANAFSIGIRITRSSTAEWKLSVDYNGGNNYVFEAGGINNTFNTSAFFGVVCNYTSSNAANFFFDDFFSGPIEVDSTPPIITQVNVTSSSTLDVKFNEPVELSTAQTILNYSVSNSIGNALIAQRDAVDFSLVHLSFATSFLPSVLYNLSVINVKDLNNNMIAPNASLPFSLPDNVTRFDCVR